MPSEVVARLRNLVPPHTLFAGLAVVGLAVGLSHPRMQSIVGLDLARQRAVAEGLDPTPTGAIAPVVARHASTVRGLTGLRAAIREKL